MSRVNRSIERYLMLWLLIPMGVLLCISIFSNYGLSLRTIQEVFDAQLQEEMTDFAQNMDPGLILWARENPAQSRMMSQQWAGDESIFLMTDESGQYIVGNPQIPTGSLPDLTTYRKTASNGIYQTVHLHHKDYRVVAQPYTFQYGSQPLTVWLYFGEEMDDITEYAGLTQTVWLHSSIHQIVLLVLLVLCVWLGIRRGLRPLQSLSQEIATRNPDQLHPIDVNQSPVELRPMVQTLNRLMNTMEHYIEAQKRFISNAAHQLKTPLAGMKTQLELAHRHQQDGEKLDHHLSQSLMAVDQSTELAYQLLYLGELESGSQHASLQEPLQLPDVVRAACNQVAPRLTEKGMTLVLDMDDTNPSSPNSSSKPGPGCIMGHREQLTQLCLNVINNAIHYTPPGGTITVIYREDRQRARLTIDDTGIGIPPQEREAIFQRFYRLSNRQDAPGNGLGLAIVKEIVDTHGGHIHIGEGRTGVGTAVTLTLGKTRSRVPLEQPPSYSTHS